MLDFMQNNAGTGQFRTQGGTFLVLTDLTTTPVTRSMLGHRLTLLSLSGWTYNAPETADRVWISFGEKTFDPYSAKPFAPGDVFEGSFRDMVFALRAYPSAANAPVYQSTVTAVFLVEQDAAMMLGEFSKAGMLNKMNRIPQDQRSSLTKLNAVPAARSRNPFTNAFGSEQLFTLQVTQGFSEWRVWCRDVINADFENANANCVPAHTAAANKFMLPATVAANLTTLLTRDNVSSDYAWCKSARQWWLACNVLAFTNAVTVGFLHGFHNVQDDSITWEVLTSQVVAATGIIRFGANNGLFENTMGHIIVPFVNFNGLAASSLRAEWSFIGTGDAGS